MGIRKDHPGVYPPPPLFYVSVFFISVFLQRQIPLDHHFFESQNSLYIGGALIFFGILMLLPALLMFLKSRNTLITILPAKSLQTKGIYAISRNPMYAGLLLVYSGVAFLKGNWWTLLLIPAVVLIINRWVIIKEEQYLDRAFGQEYAEYKNKVRRWL